MDDTLVVLEFSSESNTDRLTAGAVHRLYEDLVDRLTDRGREALRTNAAASVEGKYGRTGLMEEHVDSSGPVDEGTEITAAVGIKPVEEARARPYASIFESDPADYPLFKDIGTGLFGETGGRIVSPKGGVMRFTGTEGETVFVRSTKGQEGAHFLRETYEEMLRVILPAEARKFAEDVGALAFSGE